MIPCREMRSGGRGVTKCSGAPRSEQRVSENFRKYKKPVNKGGFPVILRRLLLQWVFIHPKRRDANLYRFSLFYMGKLNQ